MEMLNKMKIYASSFFCNSLLSRLVEFLSTDDRGCNTAHHISEDILLEIFVLLPLSSIFRFKCVSKVWFSLLSNQYFISQWIKHHTSEKSVPWALFYEIHIIKTIYDGDHVSATLRWCKSTSRGGNSEVMSTQNGLSLDFIIPQLCERDDLHVMDSSNGLVLLAPDMYNYQLTRYIVCNPLTQNWVSLPPPPLSVGGTYIACCLVCEWFPSSTCYKVVCIPRYAKYQKDQRKFSIDIFSSDENEWRNFEVPFPKDVGWTLLEESSKIVIHNGDLLWIGYNYKYKYIIVAYNLNKHKCRLIDLPSREVASDSSSFQCLNVSEGLICYARVRYKKGKCFKLSTWVLKESWELLQKDVDLGEFFEKVMKSWSFVGALCFDPLDKNVVMIGIGNCIWACNTQTKETKMLRQEHQSSFPYESGATMEDVVSRPIALKLWPTVVPAPALSDNHII